MITTLNTAAALTPLTLYCTCSTSFCCVVAHDAPLSPPTILPALTPLAWGADETLGVPACRCKVNGGEYIAYSFHQFIVGKSTKMEDYHLGQALECLNLNHHYLQLPNE
eukprot:464957_1